MRNEPKVSAPPNSALAFAPSPATAGCDAVVRVCPREIEITELHTSSASEQVVRTWNGLPYRLIGDDDGIPNGGALTSSICSDTGSAENALTFLSPQLISWKL